MKKEEIYKRNTATKNECDFRSRSLSPKAYLGCDTCRSKKVKSNNKLNDWNIPQEKNKRKKSFFIKEEQELKNQKVKLTDLCDEDKGRIVELIEELSKLEEKNQQLKVKLDEVQKERLDQQDYMLKQTNLFLEEKNFFVNEINKYKNRLETFESEMCNKISRLEKSRKLKDSKIMYFAKALQKSLKEKDELHQLMNRLKTCLKNSLESFQKLRDQVTELQGQDQGRKICKSVCCQTENQTSVLKKKRNLSDAETEEEEFFSACNQGSADAKNNLHIINDKLEYVYQCLKKNREKFPHSPSQKYDIDLSILLKNDNLAKEATEDGIQRNEDDPRTLREGNNETEEMCLKPQKKCSKTLLEVENILKNIGHPLNVIVNECNQILENNNVNISKPKEPSKEFVRCSNFLQNKIVQKNNIFKLSDDDQCEEERILEELFYSDQSLNLGSDSIIKLKTKYFNDRPFTW